MSSFRIPRRNETNPENASGSKERQSARDRSPIPFSSATEVNRSDLRRNASYHLHNHRERSSSRTDNSASSFDRREPAGSFRGQEPARVGSGGREGGSGGSRVFSDLPPKNVCQEAPRQKDPDANIKKYGTAGKEIVLKSNFVSCNVRGTWQIFHYHVTFAPMIESRNVKRSLVRQHREQHGGTFVPDSTLYAPKDFLGPEREEKTLSAKLQKSFKENGDPVVHKISVTYRRVRTVSSTDPEAIAILTNQLKQSQRYLKLTQVNRHFLDLAAMRRIPNHHMGLAPSYDVHLSLRDAGLLMCVNVRSKPLRMDTVLDQMNKLMVDFRDDIGAYRQAVEKCLVGQVVCTTYRHQTYEIGGIDWRKSVNSTYKDGCSKTVLDYFKEKYPNDPTARISDEEQRLLLALPTKRARRRQGTAAAQGIEEAPDAHQLHLVPELCRMTGLASSTRDDRTLRENLAKIMRKGPAERVKDRREFLGRYLGNEKVTQLLCHEWNLNLGADLIDVQARQVGEVSLTIGNKQLRVKNSEFSPCFRESKAERPADLKKWAVIYPDQNRSLASRSVREIMYICKELGMEVHEPMHERLKDAKRVTYNAAIKKLICESHGAIFTIVPDDDSTRYGGIKKTLLVENAVPNQVARVETLAKCNKSIVTKIAAQILCKIGGALWAIPTSIDGTLVIGFDLWKEKNHQPVSAIVAALDSHHTRFFSRSFLEEHSAGQSVSAHLEQGFHDCLKAYLRLTRRPPKRVLIFRGGASFGDYDTIKSVEVEAIKKRYKDVLASDVNLGFVVVNRRTNVMFYAKTWGKFDNPPAGTVVDRAVTDPEARDFFLIPLRPTQGTVNPTYYRIVEDSIPDFTMDDYQLTAFKQSYGYYNWTGAIRVPAVVQYATKLATLVGMHTHQPLNNNLANVLSFL